MKFDVSSACTGCGKCAKDCPMAILEKKAGRPSVRDGKGLGCIDCRHCVAVCPEGAFSVNGITADDCRPLSEMPIPPPEEMSNLLMTRRSIRQYAACNVPKEEISALLETLKHIPTGCNIRHLTFSVVDDIAKMDVMRKRVIEILCANENKLSDFLKGVLASVKKNPEIDPFFRGAPHILIVKGDANAVTPQVDCDAACAYFDLLAQSHGFGTTWCGFLKIMVDAVPEIADVFSIPRGAPFYAMLFGEPLVDYARSVDRSDGAAVEWL